MALFAGGCCSDRRYVAVAAPVSRQEIDFSGQRHAKRGRLDQLPRRGRLLDIRRIRDAVSLRNLAPGQPVRLAYDVRPGWRASKRVNEIYGSSRQWRGV